MKEEITAKERILASVREALIEKIDCLPQIDLESPVYHELKDSMDVIFVENFIRQGGKFVYCENLDEAIDSLRIFSQKENWDKIYCTEPNIQHFLNYAGLSYSENPKELIIKRVGFTSCEYLIARTGSIMLTSGGGSGRRLFSAIDTHVVIATVNQFQPDLKTACKALKGKYINQIPSMFTIVSGKSQLKDIDGECIHGFGPKELFLFLIDIP